MNSRTADQATTVTRNAETIIAVQVINLASPVARSEYCFSFRIGWPRFILLERAAVAVEKCAWINPSSVPRAPSNEVRTTEQLLCATVAAPVMRPWPDGSGYCANQNSAYPE